MNTVSFLLAFIGISALFFGYFYVFLRKENRFQSNRFFLLAILPVSAILPLLEFKLISTQEISPLLGTTLETITITGEAVNNWAYGYDDFMARLYPGISLIFFTLLLARLFKIGAIIHNPSQKEKIKGATLIYSRGTLAPASFGKYIFLGQEYTLNEEDKKHILAHELCHIQQRHSLDILFLELWKVFFWFHPLVYLINRELKIIHEYQADHAATQQGNQHSYIQLLLSQSLGQSLELSHSFFRLPIKNRIMMLMKNPDARWTRIKYALLIPFACAIFIACTSEIEDNTPEVVLVEGANRENVVIIDSTEAAKHISINNNQRNPEPINLNEIKRLVGYPQICRDAGIQGQVLLRVLVDKSGNYKKHEVLAEGHKILREAVEKHIGKLNFNPARKDNQPVEFYVNIPFNFVLLD